MTSSKKVRKSFLLDDYSGASAAYSLRQLSSSVTRSIRVRESDGDTERDFTSAEITNGILTAFTGANDGFVVTWYDQSGNGNSLTQSTASSQPKIVSSGVVILENGKPAVSFDGTNALSISSVLSGATYNLFAVMNQTNTLYAYGLSNGIGNSLRWNGSTLFLRGSGSDISYVTGALGQNLYYNIQDTTSFMYLNGTQVATGSNGSTTLDGIHMGEHGAQSANATVKVQEFIIYLTDESANKSGIETNINNEYSIY